MMPSGSTGSTRSYLSMRSDASALTTAAACPRLLARFGSVELLSGSTVAVLVSTLPGGAAASTRASTVIVATAPTGSGCAVWQMPPVQAVSSPLAVANWAPTRLMPGGSVSLMSRMPAADGPLFTTVIT
jgi:hypothetical protein